jgi:hypothetical protein
MYENAVYRLGKIIGIADEKTVGGVLSYTFDSSASVVQSVWLSLKMLIFGEVSLNEIGGPVMIVQTMSETVTSFTGMFDGVQCIIEVHATPKSHTVHQVSVSFSEFMENEVARMLKYRQIKKQLKRKYSAWDYRREKALDEWSSTYARISLGTRRFPGHRHKTLYVWWQDRAGWETLQEETDE